MPEVVRVTIELDREVPFYQERLDGPSRLFFDLKGTRTVPSLVDATFRYDSDIVRHIRLGRHPNSTTRIVLDLENVGRYSVFTLYNPYRIVIDAERSAAALPIPIAPARPVVDAEPAGTAGTRTRRLSSRNFAPKAVSAHRPHRHTRSTRRAFCPRRACRACYTRPARCTSCPRRTMSCPSHPLLLLPPSL